MYLPEIAKNSLINCHAKGLDSVVFTPDLRMFVARPGHELWRNRVGNEFTIGMHPHHRDITIVPIYGNLTNVEFSQGDPDEARDFFNFYEYTSAIRDGAGKFKKLCGLYNLGLVYRRVNMPRFMSAAEMHSVHVPKNETAAWYIIGGKENPSYRSITYSNAPFLERMDFSDMYKPMPEEYLRNLLLQVYSGEI